MTITRQAIKRLNDATVTVRMVNFEVKIAKVEAIFSRYSLELVVECTHPMLSKNTLKNKEYLIYWKGCSGGHIPIPSELTPLVLKLKENAFISDDEAKDILNKLSNAMREFNISFYGPSYV
jgi:hypothetical protein